MEISKELKALIRWLNTYAFAGWLLSEHAEMSVEEMISEEEDEEYQKLLEEFNQAKLEVVEKAGEDNDRT